MRTPICFSGSRFSRGTFLGSKSGGKYLQSTFRSPIVKDQLFRPFEGRKRPALLMLTGERRPLLRTGGSALCFLGVRVMHKIVFDRVPPAFAPFRTATKKGKSRYMIRRNVSLNRVDLEGQADQLSHAPLWRRSPVSKGQQQLPPLLDDSPPASLPRYSSTPGVSSKCSPYRIIAETVSPKQFQV